jgi:hypothetical protein
LLGVTATHFQYLNWASLDLISASAGLLGKSRSGAPRIQARINYPAW